MWILSGISQVFISLLKINDTIFPNECNITHIKKFELNSWRRCFSSLSDPALAPALWVRHRSGADGAAHSSAEPIGGHGLGRGGARGRGHVQLESAHQSAAHEPGPGVLRVPVYRDQ